jgi:TetR/AcrR family transcriptional regulator, cholesterol catabolism regulator
MAGRAPRTRAHSDSAPADSEGQSNIARRRQAASTGNRDSYRDRRGQILKAAADIFQEKGVGAATLDDVAGRVGLDRASLYYYFSSKEQLLQDLLRVAVQRNVDRAEQIAASDLDAKSKLAAAIQALMRSYAEDFPYLYIFVDEYLSGLRTSKTTPWLKHVKQMAQRYDSAIRKIVTDGMNEGLFHKVADPATVARGIVGMLNSTSTWFKPQSPDDADRVAEVFSVLIFNGLAVR